MKNLSAFTPGDYLLYPPYISINEAVDGLVSVTVRSPSMKVATAGDDELGEVSSTFTREGDTSMIILTRDQLRAVLSEALKKLDEQL